MKAVEARLLDFLKKSPQFVIPIYQRTYSWTEKECRQLWEDVVRAGASNRITVHFVGSIVYVESGLSQVTHQSPVLVIDGQQRLTTVTLLLAALAEAVGDAEPMDGFTARKIRNYYLLNPEETGDRHFKLLLSQNDRDTLTAVVGQRPMPKEVSHRVAHNFKLFQALLAENAGDLAKVCRGLSKLVVVDIALNREQDNPQLIFESMNSTGKELSQADLIRNFVLMGLEPTFQNRLYTEYWRPMEVEFGQEAYGEHFDSFMRHYLTLKTGEIPREREVYEAFKTHSREETVAAAGVEALVRDVRTFAGYYCRMALHNEPDEALAAAFSDIRELRVDVSYPFLLELYNDHALGILSRDDFLSALRTVESYVFRRQICEIPTNSLNKTFAGFRNHLDKANYLESIAGHLLLLPSYRRFPNDVEFQDRLVLRDMYNLRSRSYWLRRYENHGRKEHVPVADYTVEHILPQNETLNEQWRAELGPKWKDVQAKYLHTLGNLTLTGYNSEYSDRAFAEKRDMNGGFKDSPLKVNRGLGQLPHWNETAIVERGRRLAAEAVEVWAMPMVKADRLAEYRRKNDPDGGGSREDLPQLLIPHFARMFEALRREVLALDPCVTEDFLKKCVSYKAEGTFLDVVPRDRWFRLVIKIPFADLNDPKKLAKAMPDSERQLGGYCKMRLHEVEDVPYAMRLVRQAFERQMASGGDE
jgi:uncharacterized protein with ParB-like and HNH nuclease domain/predicted transport protein